LQSQILALCTDPLWSTIGGFVAIPELRKRELIGPVADDVLYAGVIAINTARQPAMMELAGKGITAAGAAVGGAAGAAGAVGAAAVGRKLLARGKGPQSFSKAFALASKGGQTLTVMPPGVLPGETSDEAYAAAVREGQWWQIWRAWK
jgi:hypothetical protein